MKVADLPEAQATELLLKDSGDDDVAAASALAGEVSGGLPLALQQAAGYCQSRGKTLTEYATILRDTKKQMRMLGNAADDGADTVASTWQVSMNNVREDNPAAGALWTLLAYLAPDAIPRKLLYGDDDKDDTLDEPTASGQANGVETPDSTVSGEGTADLLGPLYDLDDFGLDEALGVLHRYSLIRPDRDVISVHRLVQAVVRNSHLPDEAETVAWTAGTLVFDFLPDLNRDSWGIYQALLPHALATAEYAAQFPASAQLAQGLLVEPAPTNASADNIGPRWELTADSSRSPR